MAGAVGVEPTRADLESAVLTVRPRLENETTARHIFYYIQNKIVKFAFYYIQNKIVKFAVRA